MQLNACMVRGWVKDTLRRSGWHVERVPRSVRLLEALVQSGKRPKFVQVGANDGVRFDRLYAVVTQARLPGVVIEPLADAFEALRLNYRDYPEVRPVNVALHPAATEHTIYRVRRDALQYLPDWAAGIASFQAGHIEGHGIPAEHVTAQRVRCAPFMDVLTEHRALDAQYLQIDTEGFDGEVIKMIDFGRFRPALIKYESRHLPPRERRGVAELLAAAGYALHDELGIDTVAALP